MRTNLHRKIVLILLLIGIVSYVLINQRKNTKVVGTEIVTIASDDVDSSVVKRKYDHTMYEGIETKEDYIKFYSKFAVDEMNNHYWEARANDVSFHYPASVKLAQALYETGYFTNKPSPLTHLTVNNHFGIKCDSEDDNCIVYSDDTEHDKFKVYSTAWFSYRDHTAFMYDRIYNPSNSKQSKYTKYSQFKGLAVLKHGKSNYKEWCVALNSSPYATKSNYGDAIKRIIESEKLYELDLLYVPTKMDSKKQLLFFKKKRNNITSMPVVYLDAGHGSKSNTIYFFGVNAKYEKTGIRLDTVVVDSFSESEFNRDIVVRISKMLDDKNIPFQYVVEPTVHSRKDIKLHERTIAINQQPENKIVVSIHANANSVNHNQIGVPTTAQGSEIYLYRSRYGRDTTNNYYYFVESMKLANLVFDNLEQDISYVKHRRGHGGNKYKVRRLWMTTAPKSPAILIEADFYTNPERMLDMKTDAYRDKFARAIADAIETYLKK